MKRLLLTLSLFSVAICIAWPLLSQEKDSAKEAPRPLFLPKPLDDDWTRWIVGQWEGGGESTAGKGKNRSKIELGLNGQFLIVYGESEITEINADYLKKNLHATDEEIERFKTLPYRSLEIYTIDPKTGEVLGYVFDSLRCIATGKGKRQGNKETIDWQWSVQGVGTSTRIIEKVDNNRLMGIEKYALPNGAFMEDRGEMIRCKNSAAAEGEKK